MNIQEKVEQIVPPEQRIAKVGEKFCTEHLMCTLPAGHKGKKHIAHSTLGFIEHEWVREEQILKPKLEPITDEPFSP